MLMKYKKQYGLTLIEVLIALAIVGISLTAVIKASSQNIRSTAYLQDKTIAMWIGQYILSEARTGVLKLPDPPDKAQDNITMLNTNWYWQAKQEATPNKRIKKITVQVYRQESNAEENNPIINLETYIYHAETT